MARENIVVGLDVGTSTIKVVVASVVSENKKPQIIATAQVPSFGVRRGAVVDLEEVSQNIKKCVEDAERISGQSISDVVVNFGGNHIVCRSSRGVVAVSRADGEVSDEDMNRVIAAAKAISLPQNREILHIIPRQFYLDGQEGIKDPRGMSGVRLEVEALVIECSTPSIKNLQKAVEESDLSVSGLVLSSLASAEAVLSKRQKELGVLLLDIGGGTTGLTVIEEGAIIHTCTLPIGGGHITNDIAIGLRTSVDVAEQVKVQYGAASVEVMHKKENIDLSKISGEELSIPRKQVVEIIQARLEEILDMAQKELKKIDRQGLLPAGAVLIGGTTKLPGIVDVVKKELGLPTQIGYPKEIDGIIDRVDDPSFATAVGLAIWGASSESSKSFGVGNFVNVQKSLNKVVKWAKHFLP